MRKKTWIVTGVLAAVFSFFVVSSVLAQASRGQPTSEAKKIARTAYAQGQELYKAGKYEEAEEAFHKAFDAVPNPTVLLSIAETQKKLNRAPDAVTTLETYLELRTDAPNRDEIEKKIAELRNSPGKLSIASDPPGAEILIDGLGTGKTTPAEIEVPAGEHTVGLSHPGKSPVRQSIAVQFGTRQEIQLALRDEPAIASVSPKTADFIGDIEHSDEPKFGKSFNYAAWIVTGVGVLAVGTGTVLGVMALGDKNEFDKNPTKKTADRGERLALFADVAFGVGAAAIVTGVVLWLTQDSGNGEQKAASASIFSQKASLSVTPVISPSYSGIATRLQL